MSSLPAGSGASPLQSGRRRNAMWSRATGSAFALPVSTSLRFALLVAAVMVSSFTVYEAIYLAGPRKTAFYARVLACRARALSRPLGGLSARGSALTRLNACLSGAEHSEALWGLLGVGVLAVTAGALFAAQPWWYQRRLGLSELTKAGAASLIGRLEELRERAGARPVTWLLQPRNLRLSAFAFGRPGRPYVAISGGAAVVAVREPAAFDAVVLHELAHVNGRDIGQTYLAIAVWRAFIACSLLPMAGLLLFTHELGSPLRWLWRVAVLTLIVYLLRNAIVRSREFDADARVLEIDPGTELGAVLAGLPARPSRGVGRRLRRLFWLHPSGQDRAGALLRPEPLYRCRFADGLAIGLVTAIGATAATQLAALLTTSPSRTLLVPAAITAVFPAVSLTVAMWRRQLHQASPATMMGWTAGLGLGAGLAVGPIIALPTALAQGLPPDTLNLPGIGVLLVWATLAIAVFTPAPAWIAIWADAWQRRAAPYARREPAPGGLVVASVAAWLLMVAGLDLLLTTFNPVQTTPTAIWHQIGLFLNLTGFDITLQPGAWLVGLAVVAVPLAGFLAHRLRQRSGWPVRPAIERRQVLAAALAGLAGCLTVVALTLAISAVTRAHIAWPVRWNAFFHIRLVAFDQQAIVVAAVVFALIVAARAANSAALVAAAVVVSAAVAAAGALVLSNLAAIARCLPPLSVEYANPPGHCSAAASVLYLRQTILGAVLVSILLIPAAYTAARSLAERRTRPERRRTGSLAWRRLAAIVAAVAAVIGTVLWAPQAIAHGVAPLRGIGRDGWINGDGFRIRLLSGWDTSAVARGRQELLLGLPGFGGTIEVLSAPADPSFITRYRSVLRRAGARTARLDGVRGLEITRAGLPGDELELWFVVRGHAEYQITLKGPHADRGFFQGELAGMLSTWRWASPQLAS